MDMDILHEPSEGTKDDDAVKLEKFRKHMKWCLRNCPGKIDQVVRQSDNPEMYQEEVRRYKQAKLGRVLNFTTARRLEQGQFFYKEYYPEWKMAYIRKEEDEEEGCYKISPTPPVSSYKEDLQLETENSKITKLTDVVLCYSVGKQEYETGGGTLEAHVNGFRYTTSNSSFHIDFIYKNVKHAFFRSEDEVRPPLLHFNLHVPINVGGTLEANDIQFQLMKTLVGLKIWGLKISADDSGEIHKEKDYNKEFQKFVKKVQAKWNPHLLSFQLPLKKHEFHGSSGIFALTKFCLAGIIETPFFVVALTEIEFVNLASLKSGETDMTIVLKDFTRDVFEISSIPSTSVAVIKDWFDIIGVKYYENKEKHDWNDILENIRNHPENFIENGCWRSVNLESSAAAELSSDSDMSEESESDFDEEEEEEFPWEELLNECRSTSEHSKGE